MIVVEALLMLGVRASEMRVYPLDERTVVTVHLSVTEPTTCVFPAPIKAVVGANVSTKADEGPGILLSHEAGTEYFHLRLLKEGAKGALNVVLRGKVYALVLAGGEVDRAVVFIDEPLAGGKATEVSEEMLHGLIERAKQVDRGEGPRDLAVTADVARPDRRILYRGFTATIERIVRFEAEDTLVFRVRLETPGDVPVPYDSKALAIRLDRELFPAAVADGSGAIPPRGSSVVWLAIRGTPGGGRANLPVTGDYSVIVPHP